MVRPGKACRYTRLVEDAFTLPIGLPVKEVGRSASVGASKSIVDVSVDLRIDRSFRCCHFWRHNRRFCALILPAQIGLELLSLLGVVSLMDIEDQLPWVHCLDESLKLSVV